MEDRNDVNNGSQVIGEFLHHGPAGVGGVKGIWVSETPAGCGTGGEARVHSSLTYNSASCAKSMSMSLPVIVHG